MSMRDDVLHLRLESSWLSVKVAGVSDFRTFANANPEGGSLANYSAGRPCNSSELVDELISFSGVNSL
jgi:hypothetical protein